VAGINIKIRLMEPEDISGILEVDRKISGKARAITYRDLVREALGGQIDLSFVAEMDNQFVGFVMACSPSPQPSPARGEGINGLFSM
jgi:predicted N-acetyltransferase YhbS